MAEFARFSRLRWQNVSRLKSCDFSYHWACDFSYHWAEVWVWFRFRSAEVNRPEGKAAAWKSWLAAAGLLLPVVGLYAAHYAHGWAAGEVPTGFIQYDMAGYMAAAREHFDSGRFTLTYANPASPSPDAPRIYFQPMTLLLGVLVRLTGEDPGAVFVLFGLAAGLVAVRLAIAVFEDLVGLDSRAKKLTLVCFVWGGGLMAGSGAVYGLVTGTPVGASLWRFDPNQGWWFLNLGRNLVYPTEALYHALALGCLLALLRRRFAVATLLLAVLSASHPFTGIQVIAIVLGWMVIEMLLAWQGAKRGQDPFPAKGSCPLFAAVLLLGAAHVGYYLVYLPSFEEHAALMRQWRLAAVLRLENMLPAYALVAGLTVWRCRRWALCREVFSDSRNRLFGVWFAVSFLLANHEWLLAAHQPLHFTRGYLWMPLFLLGAPVLVALVHHLGPPSVQRVCRAISSSTSSVVMPAASPSKLSTMRWRSARCSTSSTSSRETAKRPSSSARTLPARIRAWAPRGLEP